jgi:hypothetical protein
MDPNQGGLLGLFSRMRKPDEETGLNFMNKLGMAASVLNPMNPQSANYRTEMLARGQRRLKGQARNRTISELQKRADAGDAIAARYLSAVQSGAIDESQAFGGYLSDLQARDLNNARLAQNRYVVVGKNLVDRTTGQIIHEGKDTATIRRFNPETGQYEIISGVDPSSINVKESEASSMMYGGRMQMAEATLSATEGVGTDLFQSLVSRVPTFGNAFVTPEFQQYDQARRNFVNAILRRESGAAIAESEFENANKQYFPQPFDDQATINQKRAARQLATQLMMASAGEGQEFATQEAMRIAKSLNPLFGSDDYIEQRKRLEKQQRQNPTTSPSGNTIEE